MSTKCPRCEDGKVYGNDGVCALCKQDIMRDLHPCFGKRRQIYGSDQGIGRMNYLKASSRPSSTVPDDSDTIDKEQSNEKPKRKYRKSVHRVYRRRAA